MTKSGVFRKFLDPKNVFFFFFLTFSLAQMEFVIYNNFCYEKVSSLWIECQNSNRIGVSDNKNFLNRKSFLFWGGGSKKRLVGKWAGGWGAKPR